MNMKSVYNYCALCAKGLKMKNKQAKMMICSIIKRKHGYLNVSFNYDYAQCIGKRNGKPEFLYLQFTAKNSGLGAVTGIYQASDY